MQLSDSARPPAKPAGTSRRTSPAAQPSGAAPVPARPDLMTVVSAAPSTLQVRAAPQPQPAKRDGEESCSICDNPKVGDCSTCGLPSCKDRFDASTKRCSTCTQKKSLPAELEKWNGQWRQRSANREFRAQQQSSLMNVALTR
eukprot:86994-Pyramimonas_sp.AAC.1